MDLDKLVKQELRYLKEEWEKNHKPYYDKRYIKQAYYQFMKYHCNNNPYNLIKKYIEK